MKAASDEGGPEIGLLHARFPFFRREQLEGDWMARLGKAPPNRPNGCVLVSTQVAEQSVDIDADLLVTDLAPTDMLLQRIGRLWRHSRNRPAGWTPEVWIHSLPLSDGELTMATARELKAAFGKSAKVYAPYVLLRSLMQWRGRTAITLPADLRTVLETTYAEPGAAEPPSWRELRDELEKQKRTLAGLALSATNVWSQPPLPDEEDIQTRHSNYPRRWSAACIRRRNAGCANGAPAPAGRNESGSRHPEWDFDAAKAIHRNLTRAALDGGLCPAQPAWLVEQLCPATDRGRPAPP